ncbi:MAG: TIGR04282 family arsenosugar biosynthesis glycosyltransferase [Pseudomonadales bacterium]
MTAFKFPQSRILILCKAPVAGAVKTRLMPPLNAQEAAQVHQALAQRLIVESIASRLAPITLFCEPDIHHDFFRQFKDQVSLWPQRGTDLGERMANAFVDGFEQPANGGVLIGTDCPGLDAEYLERAIERLLSHDAVIGPAEDGGYGLIGLREPNRAVFAGMDWGSNTVCAETCRAFNRQRLDFALLPLLWDVDRPADLARYQASRGAS